MNRRLMAIAAVLLAGCTRNAPLPRFAAPIDLAAVPIVYEDGVRDAFGISADQWAELEAMFEPPPAGPAAERRCIRMAVGLLERIAGEQTPTFRDRGQNQRDPDGIGSLDCVDESTNTTTYLRMLREQGLLRWHEVWNKAFRGPLRFDIHWSAQIKDRVTGELYVVDSWYEDNGRPPYVQKTSDWLKRAAFPADQGP